MKFFDAFLGGGSISLFAKAQGFSVISTDIAERAIIIGRALLENSRVKLTREDVLRLLAPHDRPAERVEATMSPSVFTKPQARFIDSALHEAGDVQDPAKANLIRLLVLRFALLCHPYAQVRKGTAQRMTTGEFESITESAVYHYADALRLATPTRLWMLAQQVNAGVFAGQATVMKRSVLEALPEIEADVAYFDPPYPGVMSYEREYRTIDEILEGHSRSTSPFTAKDGHNMIDGLFECAQHIPIWILSLGNAVVGAAELEAKMAKHGRVVKSIALSYQHLPAVATAEKKATNQEFIVVGVDSSAELLEFVEVGQRHPQPASWIVQADLAPGCSERPPLETFSDDSFQQGQPGLADELGVAETGRVEDRHVSVDDPDAVIPEGPFNIDSEAVLAAHEPEDPLESSQQSIIFSHKGGSM